MGLETATAVGLGSAGAGMVSGILQSRNQSQQLEAQENAKINLYDPTNPILKRLTDDQIGFMERQLHTVGRGPSANIFDQYINTAGVTGATGAATNAANRTAGIWDEQAYLAANPDVAAAVASGQFQNGQQHYLTNGMREGRAGAGGTAGNSSLQQLLSMPALQFNSSSIPSEVALQQFQTQQNPEFLQQLALLQGFQQDLTNPFAQMGVENPGQRVVEAAQPIYDRNARQANATLANTAPGRFSSAFVEQGIDLNSRMVDDFNLFQSQQLFQGEQMKQQQQQAALQFLLGARGLSQGAVDSYNQNSVQARGLAQNYNLGSQQLGLDALTGFQNQALQQRGQSISSLDALRQAQLDAQRLQTDRTLGANQAMLSRDQAAFDQYSTLAGLETGRAQAALNPLIQLIQSGFQYAMPSDLNAVVGGGGLAGTTGTVGMPPPPSQNPVGVNPPANPPTNGTGTTDPTGAPPAGWPTNEPYPTEQPTALPRAFRPGVYLAANPDVAAAVNQGITTPEQHWMQFGWKERRPLIPQEAA